jgi:hypothetical protein
VRISIRAAFPLPMMRVRVVALSSGADRAMKAILQLLLRDREVAGIDPTDDEGRRAIWLSCGHLRRGEQLVTRSQLVSVGASKFECILAK